MAPVVDTSHVVAAPTGNTLDIRIETPFGAGATITVTELPSTGRVLLASGTAVTLSQTLTSVQLAGLQYETGSGSGAGQFGYSVTDASGTTVGSVGLTTTGGGAGAETLYFTAQNGDFGLELWQVEPGGTTTRVTDLTPGSGSGFSVGVPLGVLDGQLYFGGTEGPGGSGNELYRLENGAAVLVEDIRPGSDGSSPRGFTTFNDSLFFRANDGVNGAEPYLYNPATGLTALADINPGAGGSSPFGGFGEGYQLGNSLYFAADVPATGLEFYRLNNGTVSIVMDINPGSGDSLATSVDIVPLSDGIYFGANNGVNGQEIWRINPNGTAELVADVVPGSSSSSPRSFTEVGDTIYFTASPINFNANLYRINPNGTVEEVADFDSTGNDAVAALYEFNGTLYFTTFSNGNGKELWRIEPNGSPELVMDINPGSSSSFPAYFKEFNGSLYFFANDGSIGNELWKISANGTLSLVANINPSGSGNTFFDPFFTEFDGALYFTAQTANVARELFRLNTDDTVDLVENINATGSSFPNTFTVISSGSTPVALPAGTDGDDTLVGDNGDDSIDGRGGADRMEGGTGNDGFVVDNAGDVVVELAGEGSDTVYTSITYNVPVNVEVLILSGTANINSTGTAARDIIIGNAGENIIDGAGGFDVMQGGAGNDVYAVDNSSDAVIEAAGGGFDNVYSSVDFIIDAAQEIESAILTGNAVVLRGDDSDNQLFGNDEVNVIDGRGGTDFMLGLSGADIFQINLEAGAQDIVGDFSKAEGDRMAFTGFNQATTFVNQASATSFEVRDTKGTQTLADDTVQTFILNDSYGSGTYTQGALEFNVDYYFG